jgi:hypothetical protein
MAEHPKLEPEFRELGRVLNWILAGECNLDLGALPPNWIIRVRQIKHTLANLLDRSIIGSEHSKIERLRCPHRKGGLKRGRPVKSRRCPATVKTVVSGQWSMIRRKAFCSLPTTRFPLVKPGYLPRSTQADRFACVNQATFARKGAG